MDEWRDELIAFEQVKRSSALKIIVAIAARISLFAGAILLVAYFCGGQHWNSEVLAITICAFSALAVFVSGLRRIYLTRHSEPELDSIHALAACTFWAISLIFFRCQLHLGNVALPELRYISSLDRYARAYKFELFFAKFLVLD